MKRRESRGRALALAWIACAVVAMGCGGSLRYAPQGTAKAPGADAVILADVNADAAMTRLNIKVDNLPPPERLESSGSAFVVWARKDDEAPWQRIGALKYDAEKRVGELAEASVPLTAFELVISVEEESDAKEPSSSVVIAQSVED